MPTSRRSRLALLAVTCACASAPMRVQAQSTPLNVWRVESPDGAASHILGTVHVGVEMHEALPDREDLIDRARTVMLEVDFGTVTAAERRLAMSPPEGRGLRQVLGEDLFSALHARLGHEDGDALESLAPWVAMSMVMSLEAQEAAQSLRAEERSTPPLGLDEQVRARANTLNIPVQGLESYADQLAMIQRVPEESIVAFLREALEDPEASRALSARRTDTFLRGDIEAMEREIREQVAASPELFEVLLYARNDAWMVPLTTEFERGDAFVAVGLGHLFGQRGVLRQLEASGFSCERL